MERGSRILLFVLLFAGLYFVFNGMSGGDAEFQPLKERTLVLPEGDRPAPQVCELWSEEYFAQVSTRGGVVTSLKALSAKYRKGGKSRDFVTTPEHPTLSPLFVWLRDPTGKEPQLAELSKTDVHDFELVESSDKHCVLRYKDDSLLLEKHFSVGKTPYVVDMKVRIENVGSDPRSYTLATSSASFLKDADVESKMFRMNPMMTRVACIGAGDHAERMQNDEFAADDFEDKALFPVSAITPGDWAQPEGKATLAAVSNAYFTNSFAHQSGPAQPTCLLQIEERWNSQAFGKKGDDPNAAALYKAKLAYEPRALQGGKSDTYEYQAFIGPKEREALASAGSRFETLIDLGFFSIIAKVLVSFLLLVHDVVPSWGVAIVLLTVAARTLLFPLTWPSVKNMVHMRELKPEMDKLNEKYKDDAQAKGLAQMELWKKHGVNPMKGCLPQLASMPVWFALYTTLQTAVELYNIPFLWFPDLSESDPLYILPFVIGGTFFLQQKLMPMQGGDPAQQKMMMYFMPGMFTVFMLFLPSGLGVYMFTNSLLGIGQQQLVEYHARQTKAARQARMGDSEIVETDKPGKKKRKKRRS